MIVEKGILCLATEMLNAAVSTGEEKILKQQCVLVEDETISYALFMEACESVAEDLEKFIPDYVATVYNTLKDAIDAGQLALPDGQEVVNTKTQLAKKQDETKTAKIIKTDVKKHHMTGSAAYVRELFAKGINKEEAKVMAIEKYPVMAIGPHFENRWIVAEKGKKKKEA